MDDLLTLADASKIFPHRPHTSTIFRWCRDGVRGVKLPYVRAGRRILVKRADLDQFMQRLRDADDHPRARTSDRQPRRRTDRQRERDRQRAATELERAKI